MEMNDLSVENHVYAFKHLFLINFDQKLKPKADIIMSEYWLVFQMYTSLYHTY